MYEKEVEIVLVVKVEAKQKLDEVTVERIGVAVMELINEEGLPPTSLAGVRFVRFMRDICRLPLSGFLPGPIDLGAN